MRRLAACTFTALALSASSASIGAQTSRSRELAAAEAKALATRYSRSPSRALSGKQPRKTSTVCSTTLFKGYASGHQHESPFQKTTRAHNAEPRSPVARGDDTGALESDSRCRSSFGVSSRAWNVGPLTSGSLSIAPMSRNSLSAAKRCVRPPCVDGAKTPAFMKSRSPTCASGCGRLYSSGRAGERCYRADGSAACCTHRAIAVFCARVARTVRRNSVLRFRVSFAIASRGLTSVPGLSG